MAVKIKSVKLLNKYRKVFEGVGKYNKDQVHLFINDKVPPTAQTVRFLIKWGKKFQMALKC